MTKIDKIETESYTLSYVDEDNKIVIKGNLRLQSLKKYEEIMSFITEKAIHNEKQLLMDLSELTILNSSGIASLSLFLIKMRDSGEKLKIIANKYIHWQALSIEDFRDINPNLEIEYIVKH